MIRHIFLGTWIIGSLLILGCQDEDQSFKELQKKTGKFGMEGEFEAENERAIKMEEDLSRRHHFYQSLKGTYEGTLQEEGGSFNLRITFAPSLPPYPKDPSRIRTIEEITSDLTNLYFNVQVIQWSPQNPLTSVGCRVEGVRPDMITGEVFISSEICPNFYALLLSDATSQDSIGTLNNNQEKELATSLAQAIIEGQLTTVSQIQGQVRPTTNAAIYEFIAKRVEM